MAGRLEAMDRLVTPERVRGYSRLLVSVYGLALVALLASLRHGLDVAGKPLGADFIIFYAASSLALKGHAALAYAPTAMLAAERTAVAASRGLFLWCSPPSFQLYILPLALLPYRAALAAWVAATGGLYLAMTRLIGRGPQAMLLALAFPAAFLNLVQGQTGFLTAGLLGAGLLLIDRRPTLAGVCLGLLLYKPHLAALAPLALLAGGRWRALAATVATAGLLAIASATIFGTAAWIDFLKTLPLVARNLADGALPIAKDPSLFAALRLLGAPQSMALAANLAVAAPVVLLTLKAWRDSAPVGLLAALTATAALIASPYAFDYDLVVMAIPLGVLAQHLRSHVGHPGDRLLCAAGFAAPLLLEPLALFAHIQLMPLVLLAIFAAVWRQAYPRTVEARPEPDGTARALAG